MAVKSELRYLFENIKFHIASAMEYRANFLIMTCAMFFNDIFLLIFWWILFDRFNEIRGWYFKDVMLLIAVVAVSIGLTRVLFADAAKLYKKIAEGGLDYYLALPKNVLLNSIVKLDYTGVGDLVFGLLLGSYLVGITKIPLFLLVALCGTIVFTSFMIIINSTSFFIGRGEAISSSLEVAIIVFATYPFSLFSGVSRFLLLTILPAGFIGGIPVSILQQFNLQWFLILIGFTALIALVAYGFFRLGLRKYESGSMIVVRV
jgi:ABC-2 type transport system permease protein